MKRLLLCGADPKIGDGHGTTPLHVAANKFFDALEVMVDESDGG
jgi:hypothetical protein